MLGDLRIFSWKSKQSQQIEAEQYEKWAFPYGERQRERLSALLEKLFPKDGAALALISYLTCRELFEECAKTRRDDSEVAEHLVGEVKKYKHMIRRGEMPLYTALVLVERGIDERLDYPPAEAVRARAQTLEKLYLS